MHAQVLLCINQHTTPEVISFTDSKDMIGGGERTKNGSREFLMTNYSLVSVVRVTSRDPVNAH